MLPQAESSESAVPRRRFRLRFSLLTLLVLVTLVCVVLGLVRKPGSQAEASFRVGAQQFSTAENGPRFDAVEYEIFKRSQLQVVTSPWLLQAALRDPVINALPILAGRNDPVAWLQERIKADFPQQGEILTIKLEGRRSQLAEVKLVVTAVAKAYHEETQYRERMLRLFELDSAQKHASDMRQLYEVRLQAAGETTKKGATPIAAQMEQVELEMTKQLWTDAIKQVELQKTNMRRPARVEMLHEAIGTEWGFSYW